MAESVVSSVVQTIGRLLSDEAKFLWGVEEKVNDLQNELELIRGFLRDADARQEHSQAVREWVTQLRDIAYDAEDVIERYILRAALKKEGRNIIEAYAWFVAKCMCWHVHEVGTEIDGLKTRLLNLRTGMQGLHILRMNEGERKQARVLIPKRTHAHFEEDIVGRENSIEELVKELKDGEHHRVISICGMGGLGKTTLAKKVFTHDKVQNHFEGFAWACVSQEYHVRDILEGILVKLIPDDQREEVMKMREDELLENLYKTQKQRRCIVVLDDIWTKEAWDGLRDAFPVKNSTSKLLITTRNTDIAKHIDEHGFLHEPWCLSDQESWELLMKRVFPEMKSKASLRLAIGLSLVGPEVGQGSASSHPVEGITRQAKMEGQISVITEDMKMFGHKLLKKCGGLPLAVVVLGGLLRGNNWETVFKKINFHFGDQSAVSVMLALSYDDLPWHLKPCFLYLGSFPEDAEIRASELLRMWIAEGFVSPDAYDEEREIRVEDVAEQYLIELVNRGMVLARFNLSGKIKTCHLHDLMRDFCVSKAKQESFLSILNETDDCSSLMAKQVALTCKTRRLSVNMHSIAKGNIIQREKQIGRTMLRLRTLIVFKGNWELFQPISINCKFIRVLKLEHLYQTRRNLPESVGELVHLRFLSLTGSDFDGLPRSMGNLVCMEFLDLRVDSNVMVTLPNVLWKMRMLRYLHLPLHFVVNEECYRNRKKLRLETLSNLQTLRNFSLKMCDVSDVGKLTNLQKLTMYNAGELDINPQLAKFNLKLLQSSTFRFEGVVSFTESKLSEMASYPHTCKLSICAKIEKLPEHKNLPQQLRKLILFFSGLKEDPMPTLEKLQHLVVLMLGYDAFVGEEMVCSARGFPQLKYLVFYGLQNLKEWRVDEGAMPHLSQLGISACPKLKAVPQGVHTHNPSEYVDDEISKYRVRRYRMFKRLDEALMVQEAALQFIDAHGLTGLEEHEASDEGALSNNETPDENSVIR